MQVGTFDEVYAKYAGLYPEMAPDRLRVRAVTAEEYWIPSMRVLDAHVRGGGKAWDYRLDFTETTGRMQGLAYHSLDTPMVWDKPREGVGNAADEAALAGQMHAAWVAFIKGDTPAAAGLPVWPVYGSGTRETMVFDVTSRVEAKPQEAEMRLWDGLL
jgi:para-nitrobenzyl esterase